MITLALTGDVMLGRGVNETLPDVRPEEPWGDVLPLLRSADLRIINLECTVTEHERPWSRTPTNAWSYVTSGDTTFPRDLDIFAPSRVIIPCVKRLSKGSWAER